MRWGLGPVFIYECLTNARRWQTYALRSLGAAALLAAMWTIAYSEDEVTQGKSWRDYAQLGVAYFYALIGVELSLVMLAAPAATAGAICLDRARGTLAHMLMTDLSDPEIVLGKLAARLMPVMGLVACSWPVMAMCALLGGIDPIALTLAFAIIVDVAILGCTIALTLSVWARKSHEVILATYTVFILGLLLWPMWELMSRVYGAPPPWTLLFNPFYMAFAPYAVPGKLGLWDYLGFFGVTLGASAALAGLAVWRTRPVACRGTAEKSRGPRLGLMGRIGRWLPGPSLDRNPVLWREWHRSKPSRWMLALLALLMGTTGVLCVIGAVLFWKNGAQFGPSVDPWQLAGVFSYILYAIFGLLMLAAIAPTSMAEERQRGSLDVLAATALSTRSIVIGKWLGTFRLAALIPIAPGLLALAMATAPEDPSIALNFATGGPPDYYSTIAMGHRLYGVIVVIATILAHGALITSIGLALAVWMKRLSRAIAFSVGLSIVIGAVWPILVSIMMHAPGYRIQGLISLSPIVAMTNMVNFFTMRRRAFSDGMLWWGTFWAVEVLVLALGLLCLTIRTFDDCFDRIPDQPRRTPVRAVGVMVLAGLIGAGSIVWAIEACYVGILPRDLDLPTSSGILAYTLLLTIGLVLVATVPATLVSAYDKRRAAATEEGPIISARQFVLGQWWDSFRLVMLLAIGPGILALALGTAHKKLEPVLKLKTLPSGVQVQTWEPPDPARANDELAGEFRLGPRLISVASLIVTILVHGAAAVGIGLALSIGIKRSRNARAVGAGLLIATVIIMPLYVIILMNQPYSYGILMWNFVMAADTLLQSLFSRIDPGIGGTLATILSWDVVVALFTAGLLWLSIGMWRRRALGPSKGKPALDRDGEDAALDVEPALIGD
jgi:ABC-type transport system involved in multi-copper enzyme maturation permease subunit